MTQPALTPHSETWEQKAHRLALEMRAATEQIHAAIRENRPRAAGNLIRQRRDLSYALHCHLERVE